jgi:hypothetical protein
MGRYKNNIFSGKRAAPPRGEAAVHILVDGFDILGVHIQYWTLLAVLVVVVSIVVNSRRGGGNSN